MYTPEFKKPESYHVKPPEPGVQHKDPLYQALSSALLDQIDRCFKMSSPGNAKPGDGGYCKDSDAADAFWYRLLKQISQIPSR